MKCFFSPVPRFYVRPAKRKRYVSLRIKVWNVATSRWLYVSTDITVDCRTFGESFGTDGTPRPSAPEDIVPAVERYRAAANMVLAHVVALGKLPEVTSDWLNRRINNVVSRMKQNEESNFKQPIVVGASPLDKDARKVCLGCKFFGEVCAAPWRYAYQADAAAEIAALNGTCVMRTKPQGEPQEGGES